MKNLSIGSQGVALTVVIFAVSILFTLTGAALLFSGLDLKATSALKTGTIALQVADTAIQHALAVIPAGTIFPYNSTTEIVPLTAHPTISGYSYSVTAVNTAGNSQAILTATAVGPNSTKKVVVAYIGRGSFGLGAVSMPGSPANNTETDFSGDSFSINGNDSCNAAPPAPGIVVTDSALATEITNDTTTDGGLEPGQMDNVIGAGGIPSVVTIPPLSQSVSQMAQAYLDLSHTVLDGGNFSSNETWGTSGSPRITRITGNAQIQGTVEGYGVLVVEGSLDVSGNFTFHGLVITRGDIQVQFTGNAGLYGSLIIGESTNLDPNLELDVRGNATVRYDSCALASADSWAPLPKAPKLLAWQEKFN